MIDFHCHLDLYDEPKDVLAGIEQQMEFVLAVTTTPRAWDGNKAIVGDAGSVRLAAGLHPELVAERWNEAGLLCELIPYTPFVGEVGLDGSARHKASFDRQVAVLTKVVKECERLGGRVLSIHSRGAVQALLDVMDGLFHESIGVLHWFSGSIKELNSAARRGCWFSVGPAMLRTKGGRELASRMPVNRVLTETDGPFTRGASGRMMPWEVDEAVQGLSAVWRTTPVETREQIQKNLKTLIG